MTYLYWLNYRVLLHFAPHGDHLRSAICHLVYGLHNLLLRLCPTNATITLNVRGAKLELPVGHLLPVYMAQNRFHETRLFDLAKAINRREPKKPFLMVDVGANVGDTAILTALQVRGRYLCVEGSERYFTVLKRNVVRHGLGEQFILHCCFCGERADCSQSLSVKESFGTAIVKHTGSCSEGDVKNVCCLDDLLCEDGLLEHVNLLKVDTDGFDYRVLRGAKECLKRFNPAIFFELSPPDLLVQGEEPIAIFPFLQELGYTFYVIYTNFGELITYGLLESHEEIRKLIKYNLRYRRIHYDVVVLGPKDEAPFAELTISS